MTVGLAHPASCRVILRIVARPAAFALRASAPKGLGTARVERNARRGVTVNCQGKPVLPER